MAIFEKENGLVTDDYDSYFEQLADTLIEKEERIKYFENIYKKVGVRCVPKGFSDDNDNEKKKRIIKNQYNTECNEIKSINYFIDLPVEAHIIGVLWILKFGMLFDKKFDKHCFGDRIRKSEYIRSKNIGSTPFLFYPYFKKYESWRDEAFNMVESLLDTKLNAVMISLDIKGYFYNCRIDFDELRKDCLKLANDECKDYDFLIGFIKNIFLEYYNLFSSEEILDQDKYPFIPIGFLPSKIISNWYLKKFDEEVKDKINPQYYARYVDDILMVFSSLRKIGDESPEDIVTSFINPENEKYPIHIRNEGDKIKEFFIPKTVLPANAKELDFGMGKVKVYYFSHTDSRELIERFKEKLREQSSFRKYLIENDELLLKDLYKKIQQIDYSDGPNKPRSIEGISLDKFELSKWLSFLLYFSGRIESNEYLRLCRVLFDTLKGSGLLKFFILWQKYLSVFLKYEDYQSIINFIEEIKKTFNNIKINIKKKDQNYWLKNESEKETLQCTITNYLYCCLRRVLSLRSKEPTNDLINELNEELSLSSINKYLTYENKIIDNNDKRYIIINNEVRSSYLESFLFDLNLTNFPLGNYRKLLEVIEHSESNIDGYNLFDFDNEMYSRDPNIKEIESYEDDSEKLEHYTKYLRFYPTFVHFHEFLLLVLQYPIIDSTNLITDDLSENSKSIKEKKYKIAFKLFYWVNFGIEPKKIKDFQVPVLNNEFNDQNRKDLFDFDIKFSDYLQNNKIEALKIKIGRKINRKNITIGIANVKIDENVIENSLFNNSVFDSERRNIITGVINTAIDHKVDLLILPECYVNSKWLHKLIRISREHQMGMVFGLEYIVDRDKRYVYNYVVTLLPFKIDIFNNCAIDIRIKNHYAPREKEIIEDFSFRIPNDGLENIADQYCLYNWKGLSFSVYCCYEIADIIHRSIFKNLLDAIVVIEFNKDIEYFSSIVESLSRDLHCYLIQVNSSEYGDNRITQPASSVIRDIVKAKGGKNAYLIVEDINILELRKFQKLGYQLQKEYNQRYKGKYKFTPPGFNKKEVDDR